MHISNTTPQQSPPLAEGKQKMRAPDKNSHEEEKTVEFQNVDVWTVMWDVKGSWNLQLSRWKPDTKILGSIPLLWRFITDCISIGPWLMAIYLLMTLWSGMEHAVGLYFSSRILDIIQDIILGRQVNPNSLVIAVFLRITFTISNRIAFRTRESVKKTLANHVRYLFEARLIKANLRLDFPTFEEPETTSNINKLFGSGGRGGAWDIFEDLVAKFQGVASVLSQAGFLFSLLRAHPGGRLFAVVCLGKSVLDRVTVQSLWGRMSYVWASNPHYQRMDALLRLVTGANHRIEVVSNGLAGYIQREWTKARQLLGDLSDDFPESLLLLQRPVIFACLDSITGDLPLIFYAYQVLYYPATFSLTSVALMQQASTSLNFTIMDLMMTEHSSQQHLNSIKTLYESSHIPNKLLDGELEYPQQTSERSAGMEISFQNVSFAYPHGENVLKDVSFTIGRGQIVMIVGVNGSGKSTLLKLFNRLYDPASGTIMVDGASIDSYKSTYLRQASAMLFQTFSHFPLSIGENISMGSPDEEVEKFEDEKSNRPTQDERVREAARLGGSVDFVLEQSDGFSTVLKPAVTAYNISYGQGSEQFEKKIKEINKMVDVSSGQWQRLALSRLFYRAAADKVKLVAVDEPSASLDPNMEYQLFESLRDLSAAKGKTLVFVTHRFGYLTKRADLILVMQKGRLVEQGKHRELLQLGGEYAKLYAVQAEAFLPSDEPK